MRAFKWMSLALLCGVVGCAAEGNEDTGISEPESDGTAIEAPVADEEDVVDGADALVEDLGDVVAVADSEAIDENYPWETVWTSGVASGSMSTQACATSTTTSLENVTAAARCCKPTDWVPTGRTAATEKTSKTYWNSRDTLGAGQQIQFKVLSGKQYSRLTSTCKTEYAWVYHSSQYRLRNCSSEDSGWTTCTGWTSWKYYSSRQLKLCGSHASPPAGSSYWGCAFGSKRWVRWL